MAAVCGIVDSVLEERKYPGALWLYNDNRSGDNPSINGLVTFLNAFITFQNVIPISLYVSIEFVRTAQAAFIYFDPDIMYVKPGQAEEDGKPTIARSWNLADDLGQIEYIFSDKTGTLTQVRVIIRPGVWRYIDEPPYRIPWSSVGARLEGWFTMGRAAHNLKAQSLPLPILVPLLPEIRPLLLDPPPRTRLPHK